MMELHSNTMSVLSFFASILSILIGIYILSNDSKNVIKRIFMIITLLVSGWNISLLMMNTTSSPELALSWRKVGSIFWIILYPTLFYFFMRFTQVKIPHYKKISFYLYLPSIFWLFLSHFVLPYHTYDMKKTLHGWVYTNHLNTPNLDTYLFLYLIPYVILGILLLKKMHKSTAFKRDIQTANVIIISILVSFVFGSITDIIIPIFLDIHILPLGAVVTVLLILSIAYVINKYGILSINSPKVVASLVNHIDEGVLLVDAEGKVAFVNQGIYNTLGINEGITLINKVWPHEIEALLNINETLDFNTLYKEFKLSIPEDNQLKHLILAKKNIKDLYEEQYATLYFFRDITLSKDAEKKLKDAYKDLEEKVQQRTRELIEKSESLSKYNFRLQGEIEQRKEVQEQVLKLAYYDSLTGLYNRRKFVQLLDECIRNTSFTDAHAIIHLDIDNFKIINDNLGHEFGDKVLKYVASLLKKVSSEEQIICRIGGDEFVVLLNNFKNISDVTVFVKRMYDMFNQPIKFDDITISLTICSGIALYPTHSSTADKLLTNAEIAVREAKKIGKNKFLNFKPSFQESIESQFKLINDLKVAIAENEFLIYYQPQVTFINGEFKVNGVEALLRWHSKTRGFVYPSVFIPVAEKSNQIIEIGKYVIKNAISHIHAFNVRHHTKLTVAINLSGRQFLDESLYETFENVIKETGINPTLIELEVTESVLIDEIDTTIMVLNKLKDLGITIAIDDFGTEYSSLNYFKNLPIDRIKLDMSFVRGIGQSVKDEAILDALITLGKRLGLKILAEGVETKEQLNFLIERGCYEIQGYYFFKPINADDLENIDIVENLDR